MSVVRKRKSRKKTNKKRKRKSRRDSIGFLTGLICAGSLFAIAAAVFAVHQIKINTDELIDKQTNADKRMWEYFYPTWENDASISLGTSQTDVKLPNPQSHPLVSSRIIEDPAGRIDKEFQVPALLRSRVLFWINIYSRYDTKMRVVHDKRKLGIVYGHIDFRPLHRDMGRSSLMEIKKRKIEKSILRQLRDKLREASGISDTNKLSTIEKIKIQAFLARIKSLNKSTLQKRLSSLRTQTGQMDMFLLALKRSQKLLPHIDGAFRKRGLPAGLACLPIVESSYNVRARSKDGALGVWQFIPGTAREMIHPSDKALWADPMAQTKGAIRLLERYRSVLPDWGTTITSYNSGVGRVSRIIKKHRIKNVVQLLTNPKVKDLGFAGRNFYTEFLAANLVEAYQEEVFEPWMRPATIPALFRGKHPFPAQMCILGL